MVVIKLCDFVHVEFAVKFIVLEIEEILVTNKRSRLRPKLSLIGKADWLVALLLTQTALGKLVRFERECLRSVFELRIG